MIDDQLASALLAHFPNLTDANYVVTSPYDARYNCIAHAGESNDRWWWPVKRPGLYWPLPDYMEETIDCFVAAYESLGYIVCDNDDVEPFVEKIAIYADDLGKPTHAARQLGDGTWTSKLGRSQDIQHASLAALHGKPGLGLGYGEVAVVMKRSTVNREVESG